VTNENDGNLTILNLEKMAVAGSVTLEPGLKPMGTALTRDGRRLYVSTGRGKKVLAIDTSTDKVTGAVEAGQRPWGIALSPDEKLLFSANGPSNDVSVIDVATMQVVRKIKAGERPWGVVVIGQ
jgi:YVTN family beta-propeller protein